jgi:transcription initiation factor TFIID subunit 6
MSVPHVSNSARPALVSLVEEHLTGLIREAVSVQRHCKRARIHLPASNASNSLADASSSSSSGKEPHAKRRLHAEDINMALQWRGSEKIYATGTVGSNSSDDKKVSLEEYIKSELELRPPQEVGLTVHWLAVDGVQPDIPQNPPPLAGSSQAPDSKEIHRVEPEEEMDATGASEGVQVTQLLPRLLSEELQLYFSRVTTAIERGGANPTTRQQQDAALASVAQDSGLQELVPFLVNYVSKSLYRHVGNPEHCRTLVRMARALLKNPHLHLELHVRTVASFIRRAIIPQTYHLTIPIAML